LSKREKFIFLSKEFEVFGLRIRINPNVKREEIKVRLARPGLIEIEWPRRRRGEDIPIE